METMKSMHREMLVRKQDQLTMFSQADDGATTARGAPSGGALPASARYDGRVRNASDGAEVRIRSTLSHARVSLLETLTSWSLLDRCLLRSPSAPCDLENRRRETRRRGRLQSHRRCSLRIIISSRHHIPRASRHPRHHGT